MRKKTVSRFLSVLALGFGLVLFSLHVRALLAQADTSNCDGKRYGYPGCPTDGLSASSAGSASCGNYKVEAGEDCDEGPFNGIGGRCTKMCKNPMCSDGEITPPSKWYKGEECEPVSEPHYARDEGGNLIVKNRFITETCGRYCQPPQCDSTGCKNGCFWVFAAEECASASAVAVPVSSATSSQSSSAAAESSSSAVPATPSPFVTTIPNVQTVIPAREPIAAPVQLPVAGPVIAPQVPSVIAGPVLPTTFAPPALPQSTQFAYGNVPAGTCGNGGIEAGEECDDRNRLSGDGCSARCTIESGYACAGGQCVLLCGNSALDPGEECDDRNRAAGDGCSARCTIEPGYTCSGNQCMLLCGNGGLDPGEECDDANRISGDGCSPVCRPETGFSCNGGFCAPICGNGTLDPAEECDDANRLSGDGCSVHCRAESGYVCVGTICRRLLRPAAARVAACGDAVVDPGEDCDAGADNSDTAADACRLDCTQSRCGDAVVDRGEQCDPLAPLMAGGGMLCSAMCTSALPFGGGIIPMLIALVLSISAAAGPALVRRFQKWKTPPAPVHEIDVEDIPLNKLEMPGHEVLP